MGLKDPQDCALRVQIRRDFEPWNLEPVLSHKRLLLETGTG